MLRASRKGDFSAKTSAVTGNSVSLTLSSKSSCASPQISAFLKTQIYKQKPRNKPWLILEINMMKH